MQLYLDSFGAYLSVRKGMFSVRLRDAGEPLAFAMRDVGAILLTRGTAMSTDAVLLAAEHEIPVLLIDANTHLPLAHLAGSVPGNIAALRRVQAELGRKKAGTDWVAGVTAEKLRRQAALLQQLEEWPDCPAAVAAVSANARQQIGVLAESARLLATDTAQAWAYNRVAEQLRGKEGTAARIYFGVFQHYLALHGLPFSGRQKHPAYDPFNALLNYLYGILYTSVHLALLKNGLDPAMGFLHADQYGGKPTLAYDAIEPYRPWAEEVALQLARSGQVAQAAFCQPDPQEHGLWLSGPGRQQAIEGMLTYLGQRTPYEQRNVRRSVQIDLDIQKLASYLKSFIPDKKSDPL